MSGGTTTTVAYVGGVEEVATSGATTTTTAYYYAGSKRIGLSVNGVVSYLASAGLGSANVTLSASGSATATVLYAPYGGVRYSSGTMPGTFGFTGQRSDAASGLDYYGSRYYDPLAGQFTSADSVLPGGGTDLWGLYSWGGSTVTYHRGATRSYRPSSKAAAPAAPKPPDAKKVYDQTLSGIKALGAANVLNASRDSWASSFDNDTTTALAFLSMGGDPEQWCSSPACKRGMQAALQYVDDLQAALAVAIAAMIVNGPGGSADASKGLSFTERQLQSQLAQHGEDFGITGANNTANREQYMSRLVDHIDSSNTTRIVGTYRGAPAIHYIDPEYGLDVVATPDGGFWAAWQLSPTQIQNVVERGSLQ
jgi:RHS repeat-associated protein